MSGINDNESAAWDGGGWLVYTIEAANRHHYFRDRSVNDKFI